MGCTFGPAPPAVVVYGFDDAAMRAATRLGEVLMVRGLCKGAK